MTFLHYFNLLSSWATTVGRLLGVFPKDTAAHYRIGSRTMVIQSFDYYPAIYHELEKNVKKRWRNSEFTDFKSFQNTTKTLLDLDLFITSSWTIENLVLFTVIQFCKNLSLKTVFRFIQSTSISSYTIANVAISSLWQQYSKISVKT